METLKGGVGMFKEKRLVFFYAVSPIHMGTGTSLGVIDNPIQRERHTEHPILAGSGLKGAARELAEGKISKEEVESIFGPAPGEAEHAGAVSFSDGVIVAFPVRSLRETFVYVTSPLALERLKRLAQIAGVSGPESWFVPNIADEEAVVVDGKLLSGETLVLECYEYKGKKNDGFEKVAEWLSKNVLPKEKGFEFFREKLSKHLVLLSDNQFTYFVKNSTVVEPHVRIDDTTGTAAEGGLFFTENVPPEAIFASVLMASDERKRKDSGKPMKASEIAKKVEKLLDNQLLHIGGDVTTGRGMVYVRVVGGQK